MESDFDPRQALADTDRAAASPWIDFPRTPGWYPPAAGAWATGFVATLALLDGLARSLVNLALILLLLVFVRWYRRYRGTMPRLSAAPPEMRRVMTGYFVGAAVIVLLLAAAVVWLPVAPTLVFTFAVVTVAIAYYERAYAEAAAAARSRLTPGGRTA